MNRIFFLILLIVTFSFAQWFNIYHDGFIRSYYVSYPENSSQETPLIINMHGYGGNAGNQQIYSGMDQYAHPQNIAVVYPQGLSYSWNVFTYWDGNSHDDVGFISSMIDDISENFNIDLDRIYACGMSNGGYMSYRLACDLSHKITAFGSVTGNFMINSSINDCQDQDRDIPIIHFHGTQDGIVNYYPPSFDGSLTVDESVQFWSNYNNLNQNSVLNINDNVEVYRYYNENSQADFVHYKVYGGGHDWFGSAWVADWGFNASQELVDFFLQYRLSDFVDNYLIGDLNGDNIVNIQDIILTINLILNQDYQDLADINNSGEINILDLVQLVDIILN